MTTSVLHHPSAAPFTRAPNLLTMLSAAAGNLGDRTLALLRMSGGLNSVDPELFADRIVHD